MADGEAGQYKTDAGVINGKVAFLAPELFAGAPPSTSSDTYACAVVLYQMLAGVHPFAGDTDEQAELSDRGGRVAAPAQPADDDAAAAGEETAAAGEDSSPASGEARARGTPSGAPRP